MMNINNVRIRVVNKGDGLVGFATITYDDCLSLGSIGIHRKYDGTYRITYPSYILGGVRYYAYRPINKAASRMFNIAVIEECKRVFAEEQKVDG
jgi:DNA-binding cell septation regulator SpoVG